MYVCFGDCNYRGYRVGKTCLYGDAADMDVGCVHPWVGLGWVGLGLGRIFEISMGWVAQYAFNLLSFQVFDFDLLWSWVRVGFQTRCVDIQVVAIASLTSTFYSCSLITSLSCMTAAASCILCPKLACMKTN